MSDENKPRRHVFDGIFEYDNDLPRWWVNLFRITIVFSIGYMLWFHSPFGKGISQEDEYKENELALQNQVKKNNSNQSQFDYAVAIANADFKKDAAPIYETTCAPCHGPQGQGLVGPNLTDDFWMHGATLADVERTITIGSTDKGMPAWGEILGQEKVRKLVVLIHSIQHTNPPNPKEPQGDPGILK